jgi:hypothetical protein
MLDGAHKAAIAEEFDYSRDDPCKRAKFSQHSCLLQPD